MILDQPLLVIADTGLRFSGMTMLLLVALLLGVRMNDTWVGRFGALTGIGGAAYLICPFIDGPVWYMVPVNIFCVINPALLWLLGRSLFEDDFSPGLFEWAMPAVLFGLYVLRLLVAGVGDGEVATVFQAIHGVIQLSLALHLLWRVWRDRQNDLVEARRQFRQTFVTLGGGLLLIIAVVEIVVVEPDDVALLLLLQAAAVWALALWLCVTVFQLGKLFGPVVSDNKSTDTDTHTDPDAQRIVALLQTDKLYLQEGLTVGGLAERAGLPEYRARDIINRTLGYRNFSDFLNGYRIEDAAERLKNAEMRRLPILTIALDVGFGSIGPFNRAFKARLGLTPSEYRRQAFSA